MMMASSEFQSSGVLLDQIDSALSLWRDGTSVIDIKDENYSKPQSFEEMYHMFWALKNDELIKSYHADDGQLSPNLDLGLLTIQEVAPKSKILADEKLLEAILFSKIFDNGSEFDSNRADYRGKLVWVNKLMWVESEKANLGFLFLISQNRIIYWTYTHHILKIRSKAEKLWDSFFKQKVRNNLIESVQIPQDWSKVSDVQCSFGAAPSTSSVVSDTHQKYPLTEELKTIFLDELNSFHLDPVIKQKFVFDLKVMPDKDIVYWRGRLDHLRSLSSVASSQELQRLSQAVADLEKLVREKSAETSTLAETSPKLKMADQVSDGTVNEIKANGEKLQQLVDSIAALAKTVEGNETCLAKMSDQLSATVKTDLKEIIGEFKTDLMESKNSDPGKSESFTECKLNEMQADIEKVEVLIQGMKNVLPASIPNSPIDKLALLAINIRSHFGPLKAVVDNLKENVKILREYV